MNKNFVFSVLLLTVSIVNKVNAMGHDDCGPFEHEIEYGQQLERQAEEARNNMFGQLLGAVSIGNYEGARHIVESRDRQFSLDEQVDNRGNTLLMIAASIGNLYIVRLLTEAHATVELTNSAGQTAEHIARAHGYDAVAQYLHNYAQGIFE